jgi:predicted nucleic acid-binding protein
MRYILDACVGIKALLPEADSDKAIALLLDFKNGVHELIAPDTFPVEVAHALTRAERKGIIDPPDAMKLLEQISNTLPELHESLPLLSRATEISSAMKHGVYDCLLIALGEREACPLITSDEKLAAKFPNVITLDAF